jgi:hypothetical protein
VLKAHSGFDISGKNVSWEQVEAFSHIDLESLDAPRGVVRMVEIGVGDERPSQMPLLQLFPAHWMLELQEA